MPETNYIFPASLIGFPDGVSVRTVRNYIRTAEAAALTNGKTFRQILVSDLQAQKEAFGHDRVTKESIDGFSSERVNILTQAQLDEIRNSAEIAGALLDVIDTLSPAPATDTELVSALLAWPALSPSLAAQPHKWRPDFSTVVR